MVLISTLFVVMIFKSRAKDENCVDAVYRHEPEFVSDNVVIKTNRLINISFAAIHSTWPFLLFYAAIYSQLI